MAAATDNTPGGTSPRTYALNHARPKTSFYGCSRIADYELQGKLGEGTFGYELDTYPHQRNQPPGEPKLTILQVRCTARGQERLAALSL